MICVDASDVGISAVLAHPSEIGRYLEPLWFQSRSLSSAEKKYPILHRELLAIVFACEKFYKFIYEKQVTILTDHKPLVYIFGNGLNSATIVTRIHRYLTRLSPYDLIMEYNPGKLNLMPDFASRFPENSP